MPIIRLCKLFAVVPIAALLCLLFMTTSTALAISYEEVESQKAADTETAFQILNKEGGEGAQVKCTADTYSLSISGKVAKVTSLKITPEFSACHALLIHKEIDEEVGAKVLAECKEGMQLNQPEEFEEESHPGVDRSTVSFLKGCKILIAPTLKSSCEIEITPQENLKDAYYYSISQIKLKEPDTAFELTAVKDTSAGSGCSGSNIPEKGEMQVVVMPSPRFNSVNRTPVLKNVLGGTKNTQEFALNSAGAEGRVICGSAEYTGSALTRAVPSLDLTPSYGECEIEEGNGTKRSATVTVSGGCKIFLGDLRNVASGSFTGAFALNPIGCEIKFFGLCRVELRTVGTQTLTVKWNNRSDIGTGEAEAAFDVGSIPISLSGSCSRVKGNKVKYAGTMYSPEFGILVL